MLASVAKEVMYHWVERQELSRSQPWIAPTARVGYKTCSCTPNELHIDNNMDDTNHDEGHSQEIDVIAFADAKFVLSASSAFAVGAATSTAPRGHGNYWETLKSPGILWTAFVF